MSCPRVQSIYPSIPSLILRCVLPGVHPNINDGRCCRKLVHVSVGVIGHRPVVPEAIEELLSHLMLLSHFDAGKGGIDDLIFAHVLGQPPPARLLLLNLVRVEVIRGVPFDAKMEVNVVGDVNAASFIIGGLDGCLLLDDELPILVADVLVKELLDLSARPDVIFGDTRQQY